MSKITVRADDELVERLEAREESKSQLVREALRAYLADEFADPRGDSSDVQAATLDGLLADRVAALVDERVEHQLRTRQQDVNVNLRLEGATAERASVSDESLGTPEREPKSVDRDCGQCGVALGEDHVYCPNCGEKASRRVFCDCGDEIRSDWAFCPSCGRRTPAADVLDSA